MCEDFYEGILCKEGKESIIDFIDDKYLKLNRLNVVIANTKFQT